MRYLILTFFVIVLTSCGSAKMEALMVENEKLREEAKVYRELANRSAERALEAQAEAERAMAITRAAQKEADRNAQEAMKQAELAKRALEDCKKN